MAKEINKVKDLQGIKSLEEVELNYYNSLQEGEPLTNTTGLFAGSFDVRSHKYFVIAKTEPSKLFPGRLSVSCRLYMAEKNTITYDETYTNSHCETDKPGFSLEKEVMEHVDTLNRTKLLRFGRSEEE